MTAPLLVLLCILTIVVLAYFYKSPAGKKSIPDSYRKILQAHVSYYRALEPKQKDRFEKKIMELLGYIHIDGVGTEVEDLDRVLVAASGVIPIFGFPEWKYYNLGYVLLYPHAFDEETFLSAQAMRNTLGMVGTGALQRVMILSRPSLRRGFENYLGKENTGIHEFVHLLDKEDGAVDGIPEALLQRQYVLPWLALIKKHMDSILEGQSDISLYGTRNQAEFFAVASEYFFSRPDQFRQNHPDLYDLMTRIFNQEPPVPPYQETAPPPSQP